MRTEDEIEHELDQAKREITRLWMAIEHLKGVVGLGVLDAPSTPTISFSERLEVE